VIPRDVELPTFSPSSPDMSKARPVRPGDYVIVELTETTGRWMHVDVDAWRCGCMAMWMMQIVCLAVLSSLDCCCVCFLR
jgi:hypothetical protein